MAPRGFGSVPKPPATEGALFRQLSYRAKAFSFEPLGGFLEPIMIQQAAKGLLALDFGRQCRIEGVINAQQNDIAEALVWTPGAVMFLNRSQGPVPTINVIRQGSVESPAVR